VRSSTRSGIELRRVVVALTLNLDLVIAALAHLVLVDEVGLQLDEIAFEVGVSTPEQISTTWPEQRYTSLVLRKVVHGSRPAAWPCSRRSGPGAVGKLGSDGFGLGL
jgi:hypothetical protein